MATFQPVPKTIEAKTFYTLGGQEIVNSFYAQTTTAVTDAMVAEIADIVGTWVTTHLLPALSSSVTYNRTIATDLSSEGSFQTINATGGGSVGGGFAMTAPNNEAIAVHRQTGRSGKYQKSRIYLFGLADDNMSDFNHLGTAAAAAILSIMEDLDAAITAGVEATYITGYPQRVLDGVRLLVANFIQSTGWSFVDLVLDSQRRRLPGRGA